MKHGVCEGDIKWYMCRLKEEEKYVMKWKEVLCCMICEESE